MKPPGLPINEPEQDAAILRSELAADALARLNNINAEIQQAESSLQQLQQYKSSIIHNSLSPLLLLPAEITNEIMFMYLQPGSTSDWTKPKQFVSPLLLGKICRKWRTIAWSSPCLWRSMKLNIGGSSLLDPILVKQWLARSSNSSLCISLECDLKSALDVSCISTIITYLAQHSSQWNNIHLALPKFALDSLSTIKGNLPRLESLSIMVNGHNTRWHASDIFSVAPMLRKVTVTEFACCFGFPFSQLTHLVLHDLDPTDFEKFISQCPNILYCSIIKTSAIEGPIPPLTVISIRDFSVTGDIISEVFDCFTLPSLKRLHAEGDGSYDEFTFDAQGFTSLISHLSVVMRVTHSGAD